MIDIDASGFRKLLGVKITYRGKDKVEGELPVREAVCRIGGILHGGAFMGFADTMGGHATVPHLPEGAMTTTIESKTNFLAAIRLGDTAKAVATALHVGRTTIVVQTKITRGDGKLAAVVTQTQLVMAEKA
jgi:1,4-dihydroxy-2-naphthoyl-CoA hydrolase